MHLNRRPAAALVGVTLVLALSACTAAESPDGHALDDDTQVALAEWTSAMNTGFTISDPDNSAAGIGSGGGALSLSPGEWDVVATCNGIQGLTFDITSGDSGQTRLDVDCGAPATTGITIQNDSGLSVAVSYAEGTAPPEGAAADRVFWYYAAMPAQ